MVGRNAVFRLSAVPQLKAATASEQELPPPGAVADPLVRFGDGRLTPLPGLDGLRGLAVVAVVCFHGNWAWMSGGWLGVSLFFTLSGFLITSLLLTERAATHSISLKAFWTRRFRRLLPAAWLTLAVVLAVVWWSGDAAQASTTRLDVVAALAQVANWRFLISGASYAALFRSPSPVLHFWSLAIEEQFYLLFPLLVAWVVVATRGILRLLTIVLCLGLAASWSAPMLFGLAHDRTYYGTDTRAGELLIGALLAVVIAHRPVRVKLVRSWSWRSSAVAIGTVALVAMAALWILVDETSSFVTRGGLALHGVLAALVIVAAIVPSGPVRQLCSTPILRYFGRRSYGIYLFHWPLLVFLTAQRTGLSHLPRFLLAVALSVGLAELSARFVEQPFRQRRPTSSVSSLTAARLAPLVVVVLLIGSLTLSPEGRTAAGFDANTAAAELQRVRAESLADPNTPSDSAVTGPPVPTVAPFGDSVALSLALVLAGWEQQTHQIRGVDGDTQLGCGIVRGGKRKFLGVETIKPLCNEWPNRWATALDAAHPQVSVVATGQWETVDRLLPGDTKWRGLGDPVLDAATKSELLAATDVLSSRGGMVVWLTLAQFGHSDDDEMNADEKRSHDPARVDRLNEIIREVVTERPATTRLVDLASWMQPRIEDTVLRSDGAHYNWTSQDTVAVDFVGPAITAAFDDWWKARPR